VVRETRNHEWVINSTGIKCRFWATISQIVLHAHFTSEFLSSHVIFCGLKNYGSGGVGLRYIEMDLCACNLICQWRLPKIQWGVSLYIVIVICTNQGLVIPLPAQITRGYFKSKSQTGSSSERQDRKIGWKNQSMKVKVKITTRYDRRFIPCGKIGKALSLL